MVCVMVEDRFYLIVKLDIALSIVKLFNGFVGGCRGIDNNYRHLTNIYFDHPRRHVIR